MSSVDRPTVRPVLGAALICVGLLAAACGADTDEASPSTDGSATTASVTTAAPTTQSPSEATSSTTAPGDAADTTVVEGDEEPSGDIAVGSNTEISVGEVTIEDPTLGPLTFTTRAIGDPSLAADGRGVMFLHGFPETSASWDRVMSDVAEAGWYAVAFDQRGYSPGARPEAVSDYEGEHLVNDVFGVATEMGLDTFHLVGHDYGAVATWLVAGADTTAASGRVTSMTAISVGHPVAYASAYADPDADQAGMSGYIDVFTAPDSEDGFLANDAALLRATFARDSYPEDQVQEYVDVLGSKEALGAALNWFRANDLRQGSDALPIEQPALLIWGTEDGALGRDQAERTGAEVSGSYEFLELDGVTHWVAHGAPDEVVAAVLAHIEAAAS